MIDRQTGSVWAHLDGAVVSGPLLEQAIKLEIAPMFQMTWAEWQATHPNTLVLDEYSEFAEQYTQHFTEVTLGEDFFPPVFRSTVLNWDERLGENELIVGVNVGDEFRAYILSELAPTLTAVVDNINNTDVILFMDASNAYGVAFKPEVDGQRLTFTIEEGVITDNSGTTWNRNGQATDGPLAGKQLTFVTSFVSEWYGWVAYHPHTSIYTANKFGATH